MCQYILQGLVSVHLIQRRTKKKQIFYKQHYFYFTKIVPISMQFSTFCMKTNTSKPLLSRQLISECPNIWQPLIVYKTQYDDMRCVLVEININVNYIHFLLATTATYREEIIGLFQV